MNLFLSRLDETEIGDAPKQHKNHFNHHTWKSIISNVWLKTESFTFLYTYSEQQNYGIILLKLKIFGFDKNSQTGQFSLNKIIFF